MIRPATVADRAAVEAIVHEAYAKWVPVIGARPMPMMADYPALIAAGQVFVLVLADAGPIDALIVLVAQPDALLIENVAVRPAAQGRGHGRHLLAFAERRARELDLAAVRLYTNARMTSNIALYESIGYRETDRREQGGRSVVHLRKDLVE